MVWKIYDLVSTITRILLASFPAWVIRPTLNPMTMEKLSGFAFNVAMPVICRYSGFLTTTTLAESNRNFIRLLPGFPDDDQGSVHRGYSLHHLLPLQTPQQGQLSQVGAEVV